MSRLSDGDGDGSGGGGWEEEGGGGKHSQRARPVLYVCLFSFGRRGIGQPPATHPNSPTHRSPPHLVQAQGCFFQFCSYLKTQMIKLINIQLVAGRVGFDRGFFFVCLFSEADWRRLPRGKR